jgi:hypothetical protein
MNSGLPQASRSPESDPLLPSLTGMRLKPALPYFPGDNGVHTGVVDNDQPPFHPADRNEPERDGHATFPVSSRRAKCIPMVTNSLSFANSEFTFSNNLR